MSYLRKFDVKIFHLRNYLKREHCCLRETFLLNQLRLCHEVSMPSQGDFIVDGKYLFEVGGKGKTFTQIADISNSFLAVDNIETGHGNRIPLWMFGLLY